MAWQTTALFIVAVLNALFSLILIRGARNRVNIVFSLFVLSASAWSLGIGFFMIFRNLNLAFYITNFYYIFAGLIPVLFLFFSLFFLNEKRRITLNYFWWGVPLIALILGFSINSKLLILSINANSNSVLINTIPYFIYGLFFVVYVIVSYVILFNS